MNASRKIILYATLLIAFPMTSLVARAQGQQSTKNDDTTASPVNRGPGDSTAATIQPSLILVTSEAVDRRRFDQLARGVPPGQSLLLRSASSLTQLALPGGRTWGATWILPQFLLVGNSDMPFSQNNGALWAGRGVSTRTLIGFKLESPHAHFIFAPEIIASKNGNWLLRHDYYAPEPLPGNTGRGYAFPYYFWTFPIDQPMRFGDQQVRRFDLGESTAMLSGLGIQFGLSNENEWWGPGIRNAIVLSNNAPGFPHLFVRTAHPIRTRLGAVDVRWLVGGLTESRYFDTVSTNNLRSIASAAITLQTRWDPDLSIGIARSVYATAREWGQVPWRWFDVFANPNRNDSVIPRPIQESRLLRGGKDQLISLFARWVFPADGFELNAEWARARFPVSLHDFLVAPNHTQGYTLGLQWRRPAGRSGAVRLQGEVTQLEQSATFRDRPVGSWYTSARVIQGYTNQGQILGASIGPGASSQWLAMDYLKPGWRIGAFGGRTRWNEDVHGTWGFPLYVALCDHDVSIYPGFRGLKSGGFGTVSAELSLQNRLNAFFQNGGGCFNNGRRLDIRNTTLSVTFSPLQRR